MTLQHTDKNGNARPGEIRGLQQTLPAWQSADSSDHRSSFPFGQDLYQYQYSNTHRKEQTQTLFYTVLLLVSQGSKTKGRTIRNREDSPSGEANNVKPFSTLVAEGRRSPLVQRLLVFPLGARRSLQPENVPLLKIS